MKKLSITVRIAMIMAVILMIPSCAVNPVTGKRQLMLMSEAQEVSLGANYDPQVIATFGEYEDAKLSAFMQNIGKEMGLKSHRPNLEYHFKVLDSPVVNAFAVPGGYIYFTRGILAQLNNEAELIGVMGHEMGHITARHTASQQSKQQLAQVLMIGGMIASEQFRQLADYAMQGMQLLFLSFSRENEREADKLGVEYMTHVGYDAHKMADFFQVLNKMQLASNHGGVPTFMSTHPDPGDRYNAVQTMASEYQQAAPATTWKVNTDSYLKMIDGLVYGEDPRQGYVENNTFFHPELKFRFMFPQGWQLQNTPFQVNMAPEQGNALMIFSMAQGNNLESAAQTALQQLQLNVTDSRRTTVNGMPAVATMSRLAQQDQSTGQQQVLVVLSYFIDDNGKYYVFHGVSTEQEFQNHARSFETTMTNFSRLTDPSKINVKPKRVQVKAVPRNGTLGEAFRALGVTQQMMNELALLNNMELTDRVSAGKLIKIVGE